MAIASDSGHQCSGDDCPICRHNIAADTTGKTRKEEPKKVPKPLRIKEATTKETKDTKNGKRKK